MGCDHSFNIIYYSSSFYLKLKDGIVCRREVKKKLIDILIYVRSLSVVLLKINMTAKVVLLNNIKHDSKNSSSK